MIRINLLPAELQVSERKIEPAYIIGGVAGFLFALLLPFHLVQSSRRSHLREEVISLQSELDRFKPIVAQVEQLEAAKAQLQTRKSIIQQLESERLRYPYFIDDFLKLLPNNVWLTNLTTTLPPDGSSISVSMDVIALDHYAVADMVSNLETSQMFSEVDLGPITLAQSAQAQSISFHVKTIYRKAAGDATKKS